MAGAILTGGRSRRFGSDKTVARLGRHTMRERVAAALGEAGVAPIATIGDPAAARRPGDRDPAPTTAPSAPSTEAAVADEAPGEGPLGGVLTALRWSPASWTVVVAADLPLLDELTVRALVDRARGGGGAVAVARAGGRLQPTCACWPASAEAVLQARFDRGERSIIGALEALAVEPVDVPERVVTDVDTPEDLARLAGVWSW